MALSLKLVEIPEHVSGAMAEFTLKSGIQAC